MPFARPIFDRFRDREPEQAREPVGAAALIGWTALSVVLPGAAHIRSGWKRTGYALLGAYAVLLAVMGAVAVNADAHLAGRALNWLGLITVVTAAAGVAWFALVIHSFVVLRPQGLPRTAQVLTGLVAGTLSVAVALPFALAAQFVAESERTIDKVFAAPAGPLAPVVPGGRLAASDPWGGRDRVNVLLLGGDWGNDRTGMRTDSLNVASVDVRTGNTVLLGLPRNLEHVPFPPGSPMARRFPTGFTLPEYRPGWRDDLLFGVWQYAEDHPEIFGGRRHMGAETLKETVGYILGIRIDWYTLVNIWGFAKIIDALGGLVLTVDNDIVYGKYNEGLIPAGTRRLSGADALWFARSRTNSDDFTRMRRQRCVFSALLDQADPATVLSRFTRIATEARKMFHTDIPRSMLEDLVPLAVKAKNARVTSVQFMPPLISTSAPDWEQIRFLTAKAIQNSSAPRRRGPKHAPVTPGAPSPIGEGCSAV
ncbi:LCP family protein [Microtetraspora niveoalba]|uniref:LCP family protein n=1 Tax=Microtetraspora niveoalba TaxID=46175 RepID=UPI00082A8B83|nr:LCP family protein [Microtetraspora niveoalba]